MVEVVSSEAAPVRRATSMHRMAVVSRVMAYTVLIVLAALFLVPFAWMLSTALKPDTEIVRVPPVWIPHPVDLHAAVAAFRTMRFPETFRNTVFVTGMTVLGTEISASMAAYGFAKLRFPGRDTLFLLFLGTMMIPGTVILIPSYMLFKTIGWLNTFLPLVVPPWLGGGAFFIFLFRQFFLTINNEIMDAARIDGCSFVSIYPRIIVPLSRPVFLTVFIYSFIGTWNDFLGPLIYLNSPRLYTLTLMLQNFVGEYAVLWNQLMAGTIMVAIIPLALFLFLQRYFIRGVVFTGLR